MIAIKIRQFNEKYLKNEKNVLYITKIYDASTIINARRFYKKFIWEDIMYKKV